MSDSTNYESKERLTDIQFTKAFFEQNSNHDLLCEQLAKLDTKCPFQMKVYHETVLQNEDPYIAFYMITKVKPKCKFITDDILQYLGNTIINYRKTTKLRIIDINHIVKEFLFHNLSIKISIEKFITSIYNIDFNDDEIIYFREFFGYSQIYQYFKIVINDILSVERDYRCLGLLFLLLDSPQIVFNSLLNVFERLTQHVNDNYVDSNILYCIEVLKALVQYQPDVLDGKADYIASLTSFLINIFNQPNNFKFISFSDANKILSGIALFANHCKQYKRMMNLSTGIYKKSYEILKELVERKTSVYEELISLTCMFKIMYIYFNLSHELGSRIHDCDGLFDFIQNINQIMPSDVCKNEWKIIYNKFLSRKYKLLDCLYPMIKDTKLKQKLLVDDLNSTNNCNDILKNLINLKESIDWDGLIVLAVIKTNLIDFFTFIFDEFFFKKKDFNHIEYLKIYIDSLIKHNNQDLILFSTAIITNKWCEKKITENHIQILLSLYFDSLNTENDFRIEKKRKYILNYFFYRMENTYVETILDLLLDKLDNLELNVFNPVVLVLFLVLVRKARELSQSIINDVCRYFVNVICYHYDLIDRQTFSHTCKFYVATIAEILCYHRKEIHFSDRDYNNSTESYIKIIIALLCIIDDKNNIKYLEKIQNYLINFLLSATIDQRNILGVLYKRCEEHINIDYDGKCEFVLYFDFIKSKFSLLH
ncbi:hypothetical protein COBT_001792 [Conglomerata obtusa]